MHQRESGNANVWNNVRRVTEKHKEYDPQKPNVFICVADHRLIPGAVCGYSLRLFKRKSGSFSASNYHTHAEKVHSTLLVLFCFFSFHRSFCCVHCFRDLTVYLFPLSVHLSIACPLFVADTITKAKQKAKDRLDSQLLTATKSGSLPPNIFSPSTNQNTSVHVNVFEQAREMKKANQLTMQMRFLVYSSSNPSLRTLEDDHFRNLIYSYDLNATFLTRDYLLPQYITAEKKRLDAMLQITFEAQSIFHGGMPFAQGTHDNGTAKDRKKYTVGCLYLHEVSIVFIVS